MNGFTTDSKRTVILDASPEPRHPFDHRLDNRRAPAPRRRRESPEQDSKGSKIRVTNIHYDLTEDDLSELFQRIGPVSRLQLRYDRAGRSEGTAYVTYERKEDAQQAIKDFDGANANGELTHKRLIYVARLTKCRSTYSNDSPARSKPIRYCRYARPFACRA
jgi:RNA recognition motif-containing protein